MFGSLGTPEIVIIAVVLILLFGVGKLSGLGKDLGSSVKEFRRAVKDEDETKTPPAQATTQLPSPPAAQQQPPTQQTEKRDNQPGIF
ncbi:MAG: twin-arginine translocase TatA/TatE family subunit [Dehalococcoidia bacterium]|nr:twin-arginine translocase TatA/TatE family subunit [Dehalococcoidia bacterium]